MLQLDADSCGQQQAGRAGAHAFLWPSLNSGGRTPCADSTLSGLREADDQGAGGPVAERRRDVPALPILRARVGDVCGRRRPSRDAAQGRRGASLGAVRLLAALRRAGGLQEAREGCFRVFADDEPFFLRPAPGAFGFLRFGHDHLPNYLGEFEFRYNTRKMDDGQRVAKAIKFVQGKRLEYRESVDKPPYLVG